MAGKVAVSAACTAPLAHIVSESADSKKGPGRRGHWEEVLKGNAQQGR
ncbi:Unknown protein sequence [Pseudomonas savastanoi pv. phaseolicola]|nr:Unknown protein sequence [Pseudomonas savastanoi pv. phaseolicola]KPB44089.1 Unknown protein sequence [Pseudomonas savastanoi pv. phaseolicola]KPB48093.1 Unknown protein sequence [Pseudomonas savastanoi pv. phaseolicola]